MVLRSETLHAGIPLAQGLLQRQGDAPNVIFYGALISALSKTGKSPKSSRPIQRPWGASDYVEAFLFDGERGHPHAQRERPRSNVCTLMDPELSAIESHLSLERDMRLSRRRRRLAFESFEP